MKNKKETFVDVIKANFEKHPKDKDFIMFIARFNKKRFAKFYILRNPKDVKEIYQILDSLRSQGQGTHRKAWGMTTKEVYNQTHSVQYLREVEYGSY